MTEIDLVIFDCDGVLIDSEVLAHQALVDVLADYGIGMTLEDSLRRYAGVSTKDEVADICSRYAIDLPNDLLAKKAARQTILFEQNLRAVPGVLDLLDILPYKKCVASGSTLERLRHTLGLAGLWETFAPHIFSSEQVKKGKPAPDVFLYAAAQMGIAPDACLVIEDSVVGVQAAKAAQMRVLGFSGASHCEAGHDENLRNAGAARVFSNMHQIAQALNLKSPPIVQKVSS